MKNEWGKIFDSQLRLLKKQKALLTAVQNGGDGDDSVINDATAAGEVYKKHRKGFDALSRSASSK